MASHLNLLTSNIAFFGGIAVLGRSLNIIGLPLLAWIIADPAVLGRFDLLITIASLGSALANFGVNEATYKLYFDKDEVVYRQQVLTAMVTVGVVATFIVSFLVFMGTWTAQDYLGITDGGTLFPFAVILFMIGFRLRLLFEVPLMVENRKRIIGAIALLEIIIFYMGAVLFCGLFENDNLSLPATRLFSIFLTVSLLYYYSLHAWFRCWFPQGIAKRLLILGLPLSFSSVFYWGLSLSDRVIISAYLGTTALGIYAVCAKFAAISELIRMGVNQGMTYFIYSTAKDPGHARRMYLITSFLLMLSVFIFGIGQFIAPLIVKVLLPVEYISAAAIIPYLMVGPLLLTTFQILGAELILAEKLSWITFAQIAGIIMAISISMITVSYLGLIGPALGTLLGYATMLIVTLFIVKRNGRQPFSNQLFYWILPLGCMIIFSFFPNPATYIATITLVIMIPAAWGYWNRSLCARVAQTVFEITSNIIKGSKQ